ncbi:hypothetical protein GCM10019016_044150 [Streptomyces prasinosporus]|uniref:Transglycosylase SLT domain-containing protein n=1 Tax=Streptomyces prasinosporus TaxID=68256 RepID=A0ABP6TS12_9ACTN
MRKVWIAATIAVSSALAFVMLLVVGVYVVAGNVVNGVGRRGGEGARQGDRAGRVPGARAEWGNLCPAINPALLAAQLYQESGFNPRAQSHAAAQGIAQFIPGTWATHGIDGDGDGDRDVWDPKDAIPSAATYDCTLASYVKDVPGNLTENMLASYNAGGLCGDQVPGACRRTRRPGTTSSGSPRWRRASPRPVGPRRPLPAGRRRHRLRAEEARHAPICGAATAPLTRGDASTARV